MGSFYRASKQACELIIECYNREYGLPFTILRYGSLYGPRAQEWNGVYRLIKQAIDKNKIEFEGSGEELREFIHVYDAAKLSVKILDKKYENQYFILTGHEKMKFKDFITMIEEIINSKIDVQFNENPENIRYIITPYNYSPRVAKKLVSTEYHDIGQGMLQCINEIHDQSNTVEKLIKI
jgi:UDP-glucose 4-epimerase